MRIGLQTWGTEGDVRPFVALARGLRRAGHEVTLVETAVGGGNHTEALAGTGVKVMTVAPRAGPDLHAVADLLRIRNPLRQLDLTLTAFLDPVVDDMYQAAVELCAASDLVVAHMLVHPLGAAAEKAGTPLATLSPVHLAIPSRETAPAGAPSHPRWLHPFWWWLAGLAVERLLGPRVNDLRRRVGLAPVRRLMDLARHPPGLDLVAVSPVLCERPRDWDANHQLCGFLDLQDDAGWRMPPDLEAFLCAGPAPVFLGLGSMIAADPSPEGRRRSTRLLLDAALASGRRAIVQGRWDEMPAADLPPSVYPLERAPHGALFPRCAAVVHHAGAGTSHAAVRAGVPSVAKAIALLEERYARAPRRTPEVSAGGAPPDPPRGSTTAGARP
jgi:sterol 3beta-glucosyltransferase